MRTNFVDLALYTGLPEEDYFCYLGRLSPEKGLDVLIRAVAGLEAGRLLIVGDGPEEEASEARRGAKNESRGVRRASERRGAEKNSRPIAVPRSSVALV